MPLPHPAEALAAELANLVWDEPLSLEGLTIIPLRWRGSHDEGIVLLEDLMEQNLIDVQELGEAEANVPTIRLRNRSPHPVLITDGSIIEGGYQNRVINTSFVVGPDEEIRVPVNCVERGRWAGAGIRFQDIWRAPRRFRARAHSEISTDHHATGRAYQARVWHDVEAYLFDRGVASESEDLVDLLKSMRKELAEREETKRAIERVLSDDDRTVGLAVLVGDQPYCLEAFAAPRMFRRVGEKLFIGYLTDLAFGVRGRVSATQKPTDVLREWIATLPRIARRREPPIGSGIELQLFGDGYAGNAVLYNQRLCHLSVFLVD